VFRILIGFSRKLTNSRLASASLLRRY